MKTIPHQKAAAIRAVWSMNFAKAKPMKPTRRIFHITQRKDGTWQAKESGAECELLCCYAQKEVCVKRAARHLLNLWRCQKQLSELIIHLRNGKIPKGSHGRRTYGKDPRKSKG